jgi:LuxR family maltose regulon positive regulatory protein
MAVDAELAHELDAPLSPGKAVASYLAGVAHHLQGHAETGALWLETARQKSKALPIPTVWALSAAQLGLNTALEGQWTRGAALIEEAMDVVGTFTLQEYATMAPVYAASALALAHSRRHEEARAAVRHARELLTSLSRLAPWSAVEARLVLARTYLLVGEPAQAAPLLAEAEDWLPPAAEEPVLVRHLEEVRALARSPEGDTPQRMPSLTDAERRVLALLPTHLSFAEIASQLFLSKNTVKTQAISAYRKLGVQSRSSAVEKMQVLGLFGP